MLAIMRKEKEEEEEEEGEKRKKKKEKNENKKGKRKQWCREFSKKVPRFVSPKSSGAGEIKERCLENGRQYLALEEQKVSN